MSTELKIIGILRRLDVCPKAYREQVLWELNDAVDELVRERSAPTASAPRDAMLRDMLTWPEVKDNARAVATICRSLRNLREAA